MTAKLTPQEKAAQANKVDPDKTRFTAAEALQEGADRMALKYGKATKAEILEAREAKEQEARDAADARAAAISDDANRTGTSRPATAKKTAATPAKKTAEAPPAAGDSGSSSADAGTGDSTPAGD